MTVIHFFRTPGPDEEHTLHKLRSSLSSSSSSSSSSSLVTSVETEYCFNVEIIGCDKLPNDQLNKVLWFFAETYEKEKTAPISFLVSDDSSYIVEVGPRLAFATSWRYYYYYYYYY